MIDTTQKSQTSNPTDWTKVEYFESSKGVVQLDLPSGEWVAWVKLKGDASFKTSEIQKFKLVGESGTYASAVAAKAAVERTWARYGGIYRGK